MNILALIIQLISGAVGGNLAGAAMKNYSLGTVGNSIAGVIGGVLGGQLLGTLSPAMGSALAGGGLDLGTIIGQVAGGGVGGAILMFLVALVKMMVGRGSTT